MKKKVLGSSVCLGLMAIGVATMPTAGHAATIALLKQDTNPDQAIHKTMELYGTLRLSTDYMNSDVSSRQAKGNPYLSSGDISISSNTSMIGFRGMVPINKKYQMLWQYEQRVNIDGNNPKDVWTTRNSFLGAKTPAGTFLIGRVNTPFKNMGVTYLGYFNTIVSDSHAILGADSQGGNVRLDLFGANSITWQDHIGQVSMQAQFAADQSGSVGTVDNNHRASYSTWVRWQPGPFDLNAAWIRYNSYYNIGSIEAYRASAKYHVGPATLGAIYENIKANNPMLASINRPAYGLQFNYNILPRWTAVAEWNHAEESKVGNDKADQYGVALFHPISKQLLVHAAYTITENGKNAAYRGVDYAHGDWLGTLPGHNPWAVSVGAQLNF